MQNIDEQDPVAFRVEVAPTQADKRRGVVLALGVGGVLLLLVGAIGLAVGFGGTDTAVKSQAGVRVDREPMERFFPTPTPFPFAEMTIPHLRNRDYGSSLGALQSFSQNGSYSSYLTSYDSDGLRVNGLLTVPTGEPPPGGFPAVVFVHGYIPPSEYVTTQNYAEYVAALAREGLVVFKIDLRGHGESEGVPGGAYYAEDYVVDVLHARAALLSSETVPVSDVGLWGHSMAGNVVFRSMVAAQDIPATVIWAGAVYNYSDMEKYRIQDNSYQPPAADSPRRQERQQLREIHGEFDPASEFWQQVVPINYLEGVSGAVQVHHAINDPVVNIGYSRDLIGYLEGSAIEGELYEYGSGGHNITGSAFTQAMSRSAAFFREQLQ